MKPQGHSWGESADTWRSFTQCELPIDNADAFCQWMLEAFDLDGDTVMMAPATGFYATGARTKQVRIAYVLDIEFIERVMHCSGLEDLPWTHVARSREEMEGGVFLAPYTQAP